MTEKQLLRRQLLSSASAVDRLNAPGSETHSAWFDELAARERRAEAQHRRLEERELHKEDIQRAQLDALEMLRSGKVFINPIDRETLLRLVSGIRSQRLWCLGGSCENIESMRMKQAAWEGCDTRPKFRQCPAKIKAGAKAGG